MRSTVAVFASVLAALFAALLVSACATGRGAGPRGTARAGVDETIDVDGASRAYRVHVPASWDRVRPLPLLFVFHGAGSDADDIARGTGFDALADAAPMLVVYPQGVYGRFDVDPPQGGESADVRLVDALLGRLRGRFPVDERRVFASGFSNGAAFCYRLAADRPTVIAAIAPVAGYLPSLSTSPTTTPVPLLHVHGTADRRVAAPPLAGGPDAPVPVWARRNGATRGPSIATVPTMGGLVVRRAAYEGPTPRADAVLLLVEGEGHSWPGDPSGPISRAICEFLLAHPREPAPQGATPRK
jgi:polyhydroxybutyrate depolymerase